MEVPWLSITLERRKQPRLDRCGGVATSVAAKRLCEYQEFVAEISSNKLPVSRYREYGERGIPSPSRAAYIQF